MHSIPVDLSAVLATVAMSAAVPVLDEAKQPKANRDGEPLFTVQVAVTLADGSASVLPVKVAGTPPVVHPGMAVELSGLAARSWEIGGRHGVSWSAASIRPARSPLPSAPSAPSK
jgi:hypothetical protein